MPVLITVRATRSDNRVALNERHADHPGGSAWVTGDGQMHQVALTRETARRIAIGDLEVLEGGVETALPVEIGMVAKEMTPSAPAPQRRKGGI